MSPATLYIAGEPIVESTFIEGHKEPAYKEPASKGQMIVQPGSYAVAVDTETSTSPRAGTGSTRSSSRSGSSTTPGMSSSWPLVTDAATWVACRRDDEFPGEQAPGPTPGPLITALHAEAADRGASFGLFTLRRHHSVDSYEKPWPGIVVERQFRYGSDSYWSILSALAETDEVDVWAEWRTRAPC